MLNKMFNRNINRIDDTILTVESAKELANINKSGGGECTG